MDSILSKSSTSFFLCVSCRLFCIFIYWCRLFRLCRQFSHFFSFFILISETKYVNSLSSLHINPHTQHIHNYRNILYFQSYILGFHTHTPTPTHGLKNGIEKSNFFVMNVIFVHFFVCLLKRIKRFQNTFESFIIQIFMVFNYLNGCASTYFFFIYLMESNSVTK